MNRVASGVRQYRRMVGRGINALRRRFGRGAAAQNTQIRQVAPAPREPIPTRVPGWELVRNPDGGYMMGEDLTHEVEARAAANRRRQAEARRDFEDMIRMRSLDELDSREARRRNANSRQARGQYFGV